MKYLTNPKLILFLIIILGLSLRFYKLDWGEGLFTHPDEYHIAISANQLSFPQQMHPHFFSYGTVVIYLIYFTKTIFEPFSSILNPFLIGRFYSALFSTFTIIIVFLISKQIFEKKYALISTFLVAMIPGLIQQAHFATPESILTFFISSALLFLLYFLKETKSKFLYFSSIFLGLGLSTKIVAALFLPILLVTIIFKLWRKPLKLILSLFTTTLLIFIVFILTSPFIFLDYPSWRSSFNYENGVARGTSLVFYTRQFIDTYPLLFQIEKILPYTLGISILIFSLIGIIFIFLFLIKKPKLDLFFIFLTWFILFIPSSLLFAKWTRFIAPTLPFFAIFATFALQQINNKIPKLHYIFTFLLIIPTVIWSMAFFSIYINNDIRITTNSWMKSNLPAESVYLVEGGNTADLPLYGSKKNSLDFYHLEEDQVTRETIAESLAESDYFLIQSRRVFLNHQRLPNLFPKTSRFYSALFDGNLGFEEVKQFQSYPSIPFYPNYIEFSDEQAEETWSVFDHPVIRLYKKERSFTFDEYKQILNW